MVNTQRIFWMALFLWGCISGLLAQDAACPVLVQAALDYTDEVCANTERNQACYGNLQIAAVPQTNAADFEFDSPGDRANLVDIESLVLSDMAVPDEWGVALLQVQANLPDTLPGQNVTLLIFGGVALETHSIEDDQKPFQAFYFESGIGDSACTEAPRAGFLLQTPSGAGEIEFVMNEVHISIGSTAYFEAHATYPEASGKLSLYVLEGEVTATALGVRLSAPAGTRLIVPLDADALPAGIPELMPFEDYEISNLQPFVDILPEPFELPTPVPAEEINANLLPENGTWTLFSAEGGACNGIPFETNNLGAIEIQIGDDSSHLLMLGLPLLRIAPGVYAAANLPMSGSADATFSLTLNLETPTTATAEMLMLIPNGVCTPLVLQLEHSD
jgi:hypothetical protein